MAERGLAVDHTRIGRGLQRYGPEVHRRLRGQVKLKSSTWHMDETFVRIAGRWLYLFRAVDSQGQTVELLPFRNARLVSRQMPFEEGVGESRRSSTPRGCAGRAAQLSRRDPRTATGRFDAPVLSASNATLCQQPDRIGPPIHQTTPESDAGAAKRAHGPEVDSSNRGGTHDSQGTSSGNYPAQSLAGQAWVFAALLGVR